MTVVSFDGANKLNGIFYFWNQNGENLSGLVDVSASSYFSETFKPSNVFDPTSSYWASNTDHIHWISFHFLKHNLSLTRYSFKQFSNSNILKSWFFEGSSDNITWYEIDSQTNPSGICTLNSIHSFESSSPPFSFFRLTLNGVNCAGDYFLRIVSFELFGTLTDILSYSTESPTILYPSCISNQLILSLLLQINQIIFHYK